MSQVAKDAWLEAVEKFPGNPSSLHRMGARADRALEDARLKLANHLGCSPLDIVWTSGATEANNMVWHHIRKNLPEDGEVWISSIEHPCCIESAKHWLGDRIQWIPTFENGVIDPSWLQTRIQKKQPHLVCVMAANNETGCIQPWEETLDFCKEHQIPYFCDAAQWVGRLPVEGLGDCDWISACAHKFGGPKGVGFLKCPSKGRFDSLLLGGAQELNRRAGTENVPGILSMVAALDAREKELSEHTIKERLGIQEKFESFLQTRIPDIRILGHHSRRLWNTTSVIMPDLDCRIRWVVKLDKLGFAVSTGSACSSGQEKTSHVLVSMDLKKSEASRVLRFSSGWDTDFDSWKELGVAMVDLIEDILLE